MTKASINKEQLNKLLDTSDALVYDPPNLVDGSGVTTTLAFSGAALGDFVMVSFNQPLQGIILTGWVSSTNTVSVRFQNETGGAIDLSSGNLYVRVIKI
jgi:hypothetical protein